MNFKFSVCTRAHVYLEAVAIASRSTATCVRKISSKHTASKAWVNINTCEKECFNCYCSFTFILFYILFFRNKKMKQSKMWNCIRWDFSLSPFSHILMCLQADLCEIKWKLWEQHNADDKMNETRIHLMCVGWKYAFWDKTFKKIPFVKIMEMKLNFYIAMDVWKWHFVIEKKSYLKGTSNLITTFCLHSFFLCQDKELREKDLISVRLFSAVLNWFVARQIG